MAVRIRRDDVVYIRSGDERGKTGKVLSVDYKNGRVTIEGINMVWKHLRPTEKNRRGGRIQKPAPLHLSKVQPLDPKTGRGTRVKFLIQDGFKRRVAAKTGSDLGVVAKA
ncbi:MAG TPA: 50S ribosomal protein L24 [Phycisphaerae bacterium]|nr:50S ribosomal protein L24 [Phycisphaerae bacterium]